MSDKNLPALPEPTKKKPRRWSGPYWSDDMLAYARDAVAEDRTPSGTSGGSD